MPFDRLMVPSIVEGLMAGHPSTGSGKANQVVLFRDMSASYVPPALGQAGWSKVPVT